MMEKCFKSYRAKFNNDVILSQIFVMTSLLNLSENDNHIQVILPLHCTYKISKHLYCSALIDCLQYFLNIE